MTRFTPLREINSSSFLRSGDVMVVFGELFQRGYANGIVDQAQKAGMKVIYSTVGRRDGQGPLRPLTSEELKEKDQPIINVPLEAGFDLMPAKNGKTPVDQMQGYKLSEWQDVRLDWEAIEQSRLSGIEQFRQRVSEYMNELSNMIPSEANVIFVHTMAGGFPRAKIVMPAANRVFKGYGDRYASSEEFWKSDIGRLCESSFNEVTGETFRHLIELSEPLRTKIEQRGKKVAYVAYGYHGTEVLVEDTYQWQSYSPYLQGYAKIRLEEIATEARKAGVLASVYNAPEILTNSSSIFLGVEVSLYPLLGALRRESGDHPLTQKVLKKCEELLKPEHSIDEILQYTNRYLKSPVIQKWSQFDLWPQHNGPEQMELMRTSSAELIAMHKNEKELITAELSEWVFKACGKAMFHMAFHSEEPVWWIGHDLVAKLPVD